MQCIMNKQCFVILTQDLRTEDAWANPTVIAAHSSDKSTEAGSAQPGRIDISEDSVATGFVTDLDSTWKKPRGASELPREPFFSSPPHPNDEESQALSLALEKEILAALEWPVEEKRKLIKKMPLKVHPDKGGSQLAYEWLENWKNVHLEWFLKDRKS